MTEEAGVTPSGMDVLRRLGIEAWLARRRAPDGAEYDAALAVGHYVDELPMLRRLAAQGHAAAQHRLATHYDFGHGVRVNKAHAIWLYRMAAEGGHADAMFDLASSYQMGDGVDPDIEQAAFWHQRAVNKGHVRAMNNLAALYRAGAGMPRDLDRARELFERAANQGNANAAYNIGRMLIEDDGPKDYPAAAVWFRQAALRRHVGAIYDLACLLISGEAESLHPHEGVRLLTRAALADHFEAMLALAGLYYGGELIARDIVKAYAWCALTIAAHLEDPEKDRELAVKLMHSMRAEMTEAEVDLGRRYVIKRRGALEALVMAHLYEHRLGVDIEAGGIDEAEGWLWLELAEELEQAGAKRYLMLIREDDPSPYWVAGRYRRRLGGRRLYSNAS